MKTESFIEANVEAGSRDQVGARLRKSARSQRGASLIELAVMMPLLSLLLLGVIDMGRAFYLSIEVNDAALAGALYAFQNAATGADTTGIQTAASADAPTATDLKSTVMTTTTSHGCMCSDGASMTSPCPGTALTCNVGSRQVNYVLVNTTATYTPIFSWPGVPASIVINGKSQLLAGD